MDAVKKAALSKLLLETVFSSAPGENLDEKLATLVLPTELLGGKYSITDGARLITNKHAT